ncbi:trimeric intracellular cation channel family protein [Rhizobium rhizogenes]|uniref:trimeric intracellular cation channel family protein n=1 Tax=Rhizobium rhizogenes TaxID=359 RepID=UPI0022C497DB|nr:trimeric intracellular cation channel family protein [Rhizobium rhizogenes]MCZ7482488.1 trimeric intracellular cation channel family protein [Rhizobium rhizogenes]
MSFADTEFSGYSMIFPPTNDIIHILYFVAIVAEAMTAALAAGRREMDWIGVFLLGCITALGGGTVRDVFLNHYPLSWVENPSYLLVTGLSALATIPIARYMYHLRKMFLFLDAIGLVVFTVIGCQIASSLNLPLIVVVAAGVLTGCLGGVLRDILCNEVPLLFRSELYATVSVFTGLIYLLVPLLGVSHAISSLVAMALGLMLRLLAIRFNWCVPTFVYTKDPH